MPAAKLKARLVVGLLGDHTTFPNEAGPHSKQSRLICRGDFWAVTSQKRLQLRWPRDRGVTGLRALQNACNFGLSSASGFWIMPKMNAPQGLDGLAAGQYGEERFSPLAFQETSALSRRQFIGSLGPALGLLAWTRTHGMAEEQPRTAKVTVGAHPWVYAATQPNYDITPVLPAIFADMKYAGFDAVELMHTALRPPDAVERIGELSRKNSLPVLGTSFGGAMWDSGQHQAVLEDAELVITRLAKLGGRTLGTSVGQAPSRKTEKQLDAQAELLRKIIALGQKNGVVLNLHNHTYEVADDLRDLKGTLARIPEVKLGPDLNWLVRGGVDPAVFIRQYGKQIVFLHLRDQKADGKWSEALGEGDMDYPGIAKALAEAGFRGDAVVELAHESKSQPTRPLRESLKLSRLFVKRVLGY
jgi:sugar phosphate isomerase/epimerase